MRVVTSVRSGDGQRSVNVVVGAGCGRDCGHGFVTVGGGRVNIGDSILIALIWSVVFLYGQLCCLGFGCW